MESELSDKIRGLFDAREVTNDKLDIMDEKLDMLQLDVSNLTIKTAYNDKRILNLTRSNG